MVENNPSLNEGFEKVAGISLAQKSDIPLNSEGKPFIKFTSELAGYTTKGNAPFANVPAELNKNFGGKIDYTKKGSWTEHFSHARNLALGGLPGKLLSLSALHKGSDRIYNQGDWKDSNNGKNLYDAGKATQGKDKKPNEFLTEEAAKLLQERRTEFDKEFKAFKEFLANDPNVAQFEGDAVGWTGKDYSKFFGMDGKSIKSKLDKVAEYNKSNLAMHKQAWKAIFNVLETNPDTMRLLTTITSTDKGTNNFHRFGAEFVGYSLDLSSGVEWEHALPANTSRLILLSAAQQGVKFEKIYRILKLVKVIL